MKRKSKSAELAPRPTPITESLGSLIEQVRSLVQSARRAAAARVNALQVFTYFEIGRLIVEHEQAGAPRAAYGKETLNSTLSDQPRPSRCHPEARNEQLRRCPPRLRRRRSSPGAEPLLQRLETRRSPVPQILYPSRVPPVSPGSLPSRTGPGPQRRCPSRHRRCPSAS
jgi:uncharacterized protein DUF1016